MIVDSHCHLNFPDFAADLDQVVQNAKKAGVGVMQTICTELAEFEEVKGIAERYENIFCSVGVHPNESGNTEVASVEDIVTRTRHQKVIGIGETGLDYYYESADRGTQQQSFRHHIQAARETGLPLIVHTRNADDDTLAILKEELNSGTFKGLLHCFTSSRHLAEKAIELGFYISFSGIISFKNAKDLHEIVKALPLERLLIETDSPYLAPVPHRGGRNEPAYVAHVNRRLAELKEIPEEEAATVTTANFFTLFDKAAHAKPGISACQS